MLVITYLVSCFRLLDVLETKALDLCVKLSHLLGKIECDHERFLVGITGKLKKNYFMMLKLLMIKHEVRLFQYRVVRI